MAEIRGDGVRRAGELLRQLVSGPYRQMWLVRAGRVREINNLAIARVIAEHLWDTGERSDQDRKLPYELRDRVARALAGEVLTPKTLTWFIEAFRIDDDHAASLWTALYGKESGHADPHGDWYVKSLRVRLMLSEDNPPTAIEHRVIMATRDNLDEITMSFSLPRAGDDRHGEHRLEVEVVSGGRIETREHPYDSLFHDVLALPAPLRKGQLHEYVLRRTVPAGQPMAPHYVHVPHRRSDHFDLRVRFDTLRPPSAVWRLSGVPASVIYDGVPTPDLVRGEDGEFHASFDAMTQGFAYGLCWTAHP